MNKFKRIVAVLAIVGMVGIVAPAGATTAEDIAALQATIAALQVQLNAAVAQLATLTGTPAVGTPAACVGITFTANLAVGSSGNAVKCLQALLNTDAATQVAVSGVGSAGAETIYFGPLTKAAAVKFQEKYAAEILTPLGLSAGTGFVGAATRAKLNAILTGTTPTTPITPVTPGTGAEGTLALTEAATPINADTIYVGQVDKAVLGLNVKALGSDIKLSRLDINFTTRPWLNISSITITDGTTVVSYAVTQANTIEEVVNASYLVRVAGLNITVPDGTTKTLTIKVTPILVVATEGATITYNIPINGLRGIDGVGIDQYTPSGAVNRTFNIAAATGGLALSTNASNPVERAVIGSATAITEDVELLRFDVKATINDVIISRIDTGAFVDTSVVTQTLKLYDGDTLLAATSSVTAVGNVFTPLNLRVSKDTTKTLSIKADIKKLTDALKDKIVSISVAAAGITAADAGTYGVVAASGSDAAGKNIRAYTSAPSLALVSQSILPNRAGRGDESNTISADAKIKFNVTALGGDIYVGTTTGTGITATTSTPVASTTVTSDYTSNATVDDSTYWLVRQGETKWFEVTSLITNNGSAAAYYTYLKIDQILWGTTSVASYNWDWASIGVEYRTSAQLLQATN